MAVKIIIDSASDITAREALEMGITMLPMTIQFGDEEYRAGVDLSNRVFYEKLLSCKELPKTSMINEYRFEKAFKNATENGDEVIVILISSKLSGTYEAAKRASEGFGGKVFVLDSLSAATGERLLCMHALKLIQEGKTAGQVFDELEKVKGKLCIMAALETLEYLKKGGRISGAVAFVGGMLKIKPLVMLVDGEVKMIGKAHGQKRASALLNSIVKERGGIDFSMPHGVIWTGLDESVATNYMKECKPFLGEREVSTYLIGSTIGTHVGPGVFGWAFFEN
ncbi:MAG: DegV family protein [Clostridia bacterium]|nr:DegV family protein [Clostridia bacterium]